MRSVVLTFVFLLTAATQAQHFSIETMSDSLSCLVLKTDSGIDRWRLPFPIYQFCEGDVDGDGNVDAIVGVVKSTRFDPQVARRLFLFKNYQGLIRPLWMGSRLGGILEDFKYADGHVITLQSTTDGRYAVIRHCWRKFGLGIDSLLVSNVDKPTALAVFHNLN